jgi:hypothetical protein
MLVLPAHLSRVCLVQGANYKAKASGKKAVGQVSLVLGAGNQTPVACMDILHKLFVDDAVVVCKMNPVNEYLGSYIRCFSPDYLRIMPESSVEGRALVSWQQKADTSLEQREC